ncbi:hypothetical protein PV08_08404 [Exophiala spinifera]|uniref:Uncharacterized protein n=1 Tax=Exophiala spinifera TaxID=91928 RepID=A0A0D1ZK60_9EURO|nr:uncharacterized protein PV08_08404 [Exophiala spinifera]KIW13217.1 hypothetical protein PV08_08404 [Exophiala spinifera]
MVTWDGIKKWLVGRAVAEKSEKKILERQYKAVEESLRAVKEVTNEAIIPVPARAPQSPHCTSLPNQRKSLDEALIVPVVSLCQRSMSTPTIASVFQEFPQEFPEEFSEETHAASPDVPACESGNLPMRRTNSYKGDWDYSDHPVINLPEMTGFGRYRRSVNAPKEWQMQYAQRTLHELKDSVVAHLGDCPPAGMDADVWRGFKAEHARSNSVVSTTSSTSIDETTGTKISRGFFPSAVSSAESSFGDSSSQCRRDSNLSKASVTSPSTDGESSAVSPPPRVIRFSPPRGTRPSGRRQYSRHASTTSISPLAVISEVQEIPALPHRKIEKALKFDNNANNESAVASDDDDDDEFEWADVLELGGGNSNLTGGLQQQTSSKAQANVKPAVTRKCIVPSEKAPKCRAAGTRRAAVHRSKTIKASDRNGNARVGFPKRALGPDKPTICEKHDQATIKFGKKELEHAGPKFLPEPIAQGQTSASQQIMAGREYAYRKDNQNNCAANPTS